MNLMSTPIDQLLTLEIAYRTERRDARTEQRRDACTAMIDRINAELIRRMSYR